MRMRTRFARDGFLGFEGAVDHLRRLVMLVLLCEVSKSFGIQGLRLFGWTYLAFGSLSKRLLSDIILVIWGSISKVVKTANLNK
jgi:hypothetical protein